ncbi:hypothetical protein BDZ90DRAFT_233156 [Jaminaea rosea]|uniref:mRNA export factor GLE1 n=1 Tax=Jaminaea rosea TaxID=1569628 RepID=A0A316UNK9_9BASI|nr:hypothetical protein BDZ90DRAFT_233156 [Jaminaea rosea]PWN26534.1 hypothetical protein BDZ90DRAFT_233156 [Jaminaea rosea]
MRFALSSASEASADEDAAGEATFGGRDLRTRAGRLGIASTSTANRAKAQQQQLPSTLPRASSSKSAAQSESPEVKRTKWLPPWIKASPEQQRRRRDGQGSASDSSGGSGQEDDARESMSARRQRRRTPTAQRHRMPSRIASSSSSSQLSSDLEDESDGQEELASPAHRRRTRRRSRSRRVADEDEDGSFASREDSIEDDEALRNIRLAGDEEQWDGEWGNVLRKSSSRWSSLVARRQTPTPAAGASASSPSSLAADKGSFSIVRPPGGGANSSSSQDSDLAPLLSRLRIEKEEAERQTRAEFEAREKRLWDGIEAAISAAEQEAAKRAKQEADRLAKETREREEKERLFKEAQEAEQRRKKEEEERSAAATKAKKEEEDRRARAEEEQKARDAKAAADSEALAGLAGGSALLSAARKDWAHWRDEMARIKREVLPVVKSNPAWKKSCFVAKRQITPKIGQLTNSRTEIDRIASAISSLLSEAKSAPGCEKGEIYEWVLNHLAKCLIRQAEQEVAVKVDTAYPLARLVLRIMLAGGHAEGLGKVLMARLVKKSPWVVGYVPSRADAPDVQEDPTALAKLVGKSSPDETSVQFTSRQAGILAFYFALCQTDLVDSAAPGTTAVTAAQQVPSQFHPSALWHWSARCVTPPMTGHALIATLWCTLLDVASPYLLERYPSQFAKVLRLLLKEGLRGEKAGFVKLEEATSARGRLRLLLEEWEKEGRVKEAGKGRAVDP